MYLNKDFAIGVGIGILIGVIGSFTWALWPLGETVPEIMDWNEDVKSPLLETTPTPTPTTHPALNDKLPHIEGQASWYGEGKNECLGCDPQRIMANGQRLDDNRKTVACSVGGTCELFPIGTRVMILNKENKMLTEALVTDTGGFQKYNKIVDVSKAVKNSLNMGGSAMVRVTVLE